MSSVSMSAVHCGVLDLMIYVRMYIPVIVENGVLCNRVNICQHTQVVCTYSMEIFSKPGKNLAA